MEKIMEKPPTGVETAVTVEGVRKKYTLGERAVDALRGVSLSVPRGTFCAVVGPSGSGKSTLLNMIGLLDKPDTGKILLEQTDTTHMGSEETAILRRERLGFVFQDFNLISVLSAFENVELPLRIHSKRADPEWVMSLLEDVGLADHAAHRPSQLSGGQQQRVAIARALVNRPVIVLADEPTANLDSKTGQSILRVMHRFNQELSTTFIFSTHDMAVREMAETTYMLRDGMLAG
jgi:putative ABC transport system ATP-binding protein